MEIKDEDIFINQKEISAIDLYEVLCDNFTFYKMIELYKLIKHKMEFLDDEPRMNLSCCEEGE